MKTLCVTCVWCDIQTGCCLSVNQIDHPAPLMVESVVDNALGVGLANALEPNAHAEVHSPGVSIKGLHGYLTITVEDCRLTAYSRIVRQRSADAYVRVRSEPGAVCYVIIELEERCNNGRKKKQ